MRLTDYFVLAGRQPPKAFLICWLTVFYCSVITFLPEYAPFSDVAKVFFTLLATLPILVHIWIIYVAFVWPLYNNNIYDEKALNPFSYAFLWLSKAFSMSMIYLIFWVWHKDSFELLPVGIGAFHAWGFILAAAWNSGAGTATYGSADQNNVFLALILNFDVFVSMLSNVLFFGIVAGVRRTTLASQPEPIKYADVASTPAMPYLPQHRAVYNRSSFTSSESDSD